MDIFRRIQEEIIDDPANAGHKAAGRLPVYTASAQSKIVIAGQAPGRKAQESMKPWNDASGIKLRSWMGVTDEQFYDPDLFALLAMDFFYPGKAAHGDLPPRKEFAPVWHKRLLEHMPDVQLIVVIGAYSQKYYLGKAAKPTLTATVRAYREYLPGRFPLVHPSPLNFRWQRQNPWFEETVVPELKRTVDGILSAG